MNAVKVYKVSVGCTNCNNKYSLDIEYGKLVGHVLPNSVCKFCGNAMVLIHINEDVK